MKMRITPTALDSRVSVMQAADLETSKVSEGSVVEEKEKAEDGADRGLKKQQVTGKQDSGEFGYSGLLPIQEDGTQPQSALPQRTASSPRPP